ncbi:MULTISPECIES: SprT family zinc-dependent metalloprotease [unclassified Clostridioides]|uniref:M48 family metallopeptidase n=2 Tax=Clostridioides TaxID=1870884 RepID=UPI001D11323C|nr:M48 family metallopeptidase [Clostridioides sp. ES-S-0049-03]MCC0674625.1 M48 family metallopeptidase [Clostridioides sp. ES-W-0018-02]MCC0694447.1 M48 family metallopeptidase [Clostridioides sp. ES-S-0048-02]MCC0710559.1 M48 family metallopeptidase [Clostridioides sp. ES-W-0017-02]
MKMMSKDYQILNINFKNKEIEAVLLYKNRKNICIKIDSFGKVVVISPPKVSKKIIEEIIIKKGDWILKKSGEYKDREEAYKQRTFMTGDKFLYLGEEYCLVVNKTLDDCAKKSKCKINLEEYKIIVKTNDLSKDFIKKSLQCWYKNESQRIVSERIDFLKSNCDIMKQLTPVNVKVKEQKSRWGSCTSQKNIYINSKISMARLDVIDYIIVHEFSHLLHMNHSKKFYDLVKNIMPEYKDKENWLKKNGYKIII